MDPFRHLTFILDSNRIFINNKIFRLLFQFFVVGGFLLITYEKSASRCSDSLLLDGSDKIISYGIDTTLHWWAITEPFTGMRRVVVDDFQSQAYTDAKDIHFSPDGEHWACFVKDNMSWNILTNESLITLPGTDAGFIQYSGNGDKFIYSFREGDDEIICMPDKRRIRIIGTLSGTTFVNYFATDVAFLLYRSKMVQVCINGHDGTSYDTIKPIGFWHDNSFIYAAYNGSSWKVYKNNKEISDNYTQITEFAINREGTVAAFLARRSNYEMVSVLISDDYYEPLISRPYDLVSGLALHPTLALMSYNAFIGTGNLVAMNTAEYPGGEVTGKPAFTHDGKEMYYVGCRLDCFASFSGKLYNIPSDINTDAIIAHKPESKSIAYTTSITLVQRKVDPYEIWTGKMVDDLSQAVYNWRNDRYEALGRLNGRLYLITCEP